MTPTTAQQLRDALMSFVSAEIETEQRGDRAACLTPLTYPNGDAVVVWVSTRDDGRIEVSDLGEGIGVFHGRQRPDQTTLAQFAQDIARGVDVEFAAGRMSARCAPSDLGETIWFVATASARIAEAVIFHRPRHRRRREFPDVVADEFLQRQVTFERNHRLAGASGHEHRATLYVPGTETLVEPIAGDDWNQATAAFVKFSDIANVNGNQMLAVIDDRAGPPEDDVFNLLSGANKTGVVRWTRRDEWWSHIDGARRTA
ncbi:MAG: hypothetical protein QOK16_3844 [Solirubrobacteraceae bacterium]|jgi:hypothetical protein|nr:hypothetical protein [Solirubrobacteraceae bacterium]